MSAPETGEAAQARPFADVLSEISKGVVADDAATQLARVVAAVKATGKKGKVTISIAVAPFPGNEEIVKVSGTVAASTPKAEAPTSIFYQDEDGNLTRNDPNALALFPDPAGVTR
jgi:hypothetical protein